jgi:RNA polymerase sigma factor (sigma-70 family)
MSVELQTGDLLASLKEGKSHAFERLYKNYYPMIAKLIRNNNGKEEDAQDIFQETLIAFVKSIQKPDFELSAKVGTYLYSIAHRMWLYKLRGNKSTASLEKDGKTMDLIDGGEIELEEKQQYEEKHILMAKILNELKDDCRQLLKNFYFKKRSLSEIAQTMDYTAAFIKVKKNRCMNAFKKMIEASPEFKNL